MTMGRRIALMTAGVGIATFLGLPAAGAATTHATSATGTEKARTTLIVRPTAPVSTSPVNFSSKVKPKVVGATLPTGSVCFYNGYSTTPLICATLATSASGFSTVHVKLPLAKGSYSVVAEYSGDAVYAPSVSPAVAFTVS